MLMCFFWEQFSIWRAPGLTSPAGTGQAGLMHPSAEAAACWLAWEQLMDGQRGKQQETARVVEQQGCQCEDHVMGFPFRRSPSVPQCLSFPGAPG